MSDWPPLPDAVLTQVNAAGSSADYDRDATAGALKWSGAAPAVWAEFQERVLGPGGSDVLLHRELVVAEGLGVAWAENDTVTVLRAGQSVTGTVRTIKTTVAATAVDVPGTVRLVLDDA